DALLKIEELHKKSNVVILLGGSGLYIDAVLKNSSTAIWFIKSNSLWER
ncbi:MAG TPA: hypothetical protein EYP87_07300, partial [Flavobacteriaceae bacterium]|nr:hypothetical protein [Flavobacteriaceae bacterium]